MSIQDLIDAGADLTNPNDGSLSLSYLSLTSLYGLQNAPNKHLIQKINLDNNLLNYIPFHTFNNLRALEELHLNNNQIDAIPSDAFNNLSNNFIVSIDSNTFKNLKKIRSLFLNNNMIERITDVNTFKKTFLSTIVLGDNPIESILGNLFDNHKCPQLLILSIKNNRLNDTEKKELKMILSARLIDRHLTL